MKSVSLALRTHLESDVTSICTCWRVSRVDGQNFYFTDHDEDVVFDGNTYKASSGYNRTATTTDESLNVDNMDIVGILNNEEISEADLRNGLFDNASVEVFIVNWQDVSMGRMILRTGYLGEAVITPTGIFKTELRGLAQPLQQSLGDIYQPTCRTDLGSAMCKVNLTPLTQSGVVESVTGRKDFVSEPGLTGADGWFNGGVLTFTSGPNSGRRMEVRAWTSSSRALSLFLPMPFPILAGHTFTIYPGCDKTRGDSGCLKFNNILNFRGEPDIPGLDSVAQYPDARA